MARDDWYRCTSWSAADKEAFFARLKRSGTSDAKAQYLRIQACYLAEAKLYPSAVELLGILIRDYPDHLELAQTHLQMAECLIELGEAENAIAEFRLSLQRQRDFPNVLTASWLQFPLFVVRQNLTQYYEEALGVLEEFNKDTGIMLPIEGYRHATAHALIAESQGNRRKAKNFAKQALEFQAATFSGLRYHPTLGLVNEVDSTIHSRLVTLAAP